MHSFKPCKAFSHEVCRLTPMHGHVFVPTLPSPQDFKRLRDSAAWGQITLEQSQATLSASLGGICAVFDGEVTGMARFVGDGILNIYIQDVIISEPFRRRGLGKQLLNVLFKRLKAEFPASCTIGLMAAKGQDGFYAQFGFTARPSDVYGAGMIAPLGDIRLS